MMLRQLALAMVNAIAKSAADVPAVSSNRALAGNTHLTPAFLFRIPLQRQSTLQGT